MADPAAPPPPTYPFLVGTETAMDIMFHEWGIALSDLGEDMFCVLTISNFTQPYAVIVAITSFHFGRLAISEYGPRDSCIHPFMALVKVVLELIQMGTYLHYSGAIFNFNSITGYQIYAGMSQNSLFTVFLIIIFNRICVYVFNDQITYCFRIFIW